MAKVVLELTQLELQALQRAIDSALISSEDAKEFYKHNREHNAARRAQAKLRDAAYPLLVH